MIKTLWDFTRPHTIIGSFLSVLALYLIAAFDTEGWHPTLLALTLLSALACNVYITGLNQLADVELDKINKPELPLPSGRMSWPLGFRIVAVSCVVALVSAALLNWYYFGLILLIALIGTAYSLPPLKFKRHHLGAALAITIVRGVLVNIGIYLHYYYELYGRFELPSHVVPLAVFVVGFSFGIAWFKDIPDQEGDRAFGLKTLALSMGQRQAFWAGVVVVALSYLYVLVSALLGLAEVDATFFVISHAVALGVYLLMSFRVDLGQPRQVRRYYLSFWGLFFLEYVIYTVGYYV